MPLTIASLAPLDADRSLAHLEELSTAHGVSGFEEGVRRLIRRRIEPLVDELSVDALGNLIARRRGAGRHTVMLDAHMDEIGLMVSAIDDAGFLRFAPIGGWDPRILPAQGVRILTRSGRELPGIIGSQPVHITRPSERERAPAMEDLFVDVGARTRDEVAALGIRMGDPMVIGGAFQRLGEESLVGKAFDDRVGCALALRLLERVVGVDLPFHLVVVFSAMEEVGTRGARTAAFDVAPDLALALECTVGADVPGVPLHRRPTVLGAGPAITLADRSIIVARAMVEHLERAAAAVDVPWQYKAPTFGGTNAGAIHLAGTGAMAGVVSVPARYIHSPLQVIRQSDYLATEQLVASFVASAGELLPG